ncbi:MAG TPA: transcriptional repressor NrdR, partial [Candidatus Marinimicrobia bacterium]|nr:transcriptional repressor NrdR [Candidatus Neomarinimicrobiota bacterium]
MRCPSCASPDIRVLDSRAVTKSNAIRRRRECSKCFFRFTTYEFITSSRIIVNKTDGSQEEFSREKLIRSIQLPCTKRPVSSQTIEQIADEVENILENINRKEI